MATTGPINLNQVRRVHERFKRQNEQMIAAALSTAGEHAKGHVRDDSKFKRRKPPSSSLKDATRFKIRRTRSGARIRISSHKKYAPFLEYGTRGPYPIPKRSGGKTLRFVGKGGQIVFRRRVMHPGIRKPFRFLWKATWSAYRVAGHELRSGMRKVALRF
jgi:hypothetical protein